MSSTTTPSKPETPSEFLSGLLMMLSEGKVNAAVMKLATELVELHERVERLKRSQYVPPDTSGRYA